MADLAELFGQPPIKKPSRKLDIAQFLRFLASLMDEDDQTNDSVKEKEEMEVLTRPHFTPQNSE